MTVPLLAKPLLEAIEKLTDPLPLLFAPPLMVIQETLLTTVHEQPVPELTFTLPLSLVGPKLTLGDESENVQLGV